jgi:hypothetical protein
MFPRTLKLLIAGGSVALLAACADDRSSAPTVPTLPTKVSAARSPTCDFTAIGQNGNDFFPQKDVGIERIATFKTAYRDGATSDATKTAGWAVIDRIGTATFEGIQTGTPAIGAALTRGVLSCLTAAVPALTASLNGQNFDSDITNALSVGGLYVVPSLTNAAPALGRGSAPAWGAEPKAGDNWGAISGSAGQFLLYGYELTFTTFTTENPAKVNSADPGTAFELNTAPKFGFVNQMRTGVCVEDDNRYRMQHVNAILPLVAPSPAFCTTPTSPPAPSSSLISFTRAVRDFFTPRPAYAAAVLGGGSSSLISSLSPSGAVDLTASAITLSIDPIVGGKIAKPVQITVHAFSPTAAKRPVDNVLIRLAVAGNNGLGSDGIFEVTNYSGPTVNGVISFAVKFDKPGNYTIRADGFFNANLTLPTQSATSNPFGMTGPGNQ